MTTIGKNKTQKGRKKVKDERRRYQINTARLSDEIKIIQDAISERLKDIASDVASGFPPIPISQPQNNFNTTWYYL